MGNLNSNGKPYMEIQWYDYIWHLVIFQIHSDSKAYMP